MSKFYARFKEVPSYVLVFSTEAERNDWVDCTGKFDCGLSKKYIEEAGFHHIPLKEKEAKRLIQIYKLEKIIEEDILENEILTYCKPNLPFDFYLGG